MPGGFVFRLQNMIKLTSDFRKEIEKILNSGKAAEIRIKNGKIVLWAVSSKTTTEQPIA